MVMEKGATQSTQLLGRGTWKAGSNMDVFTSAVSALHFGGHDWQETEPYVEGCDDCLHNWNEHKLNYCKNHDTKTHQPKSMGIPVHEGYFKGCKAFIQRNSGHRPTKANQMLPTEVRSIGAFCRNSGSLFHLSLYTILLMGTDLYWRKEEYRGMDETAIQLDMCTMRGPDLCSGIMLHLTKKITSSAGALHGE